MFMVFLECHEFFEGVVRMKILFVRPPRTFWQFNSESSCYWQPLAYGEMAAVSRENDFEVEILDCLAHHIGYKTLFKTLEKKNYDVICLGDETASAHESVKVCKFVKENKPDA